MLKYFDAQEYVNTSETYSNRILVGNNIVVIPYYNINLLPENPLKVGNSNIDYGYCVFLDVSSIGINSTKGGIISIRYAEISDRPELTEFVSFGGFQSEYSAELEIHCRKFVLYLPDAYSSKKFPELFIVKTTARNVQNMVEATIQKFLNFETRPDEIVTLLGSQHSSITLH